MLYEVTVGRDTYLGTPEEVVGWMARAVGAPGDGTPASYMAGVAARLAERDPMLEVDVSSPSEFLDALAAHGLLRVRERREASAERVDPKEVLGEGPVAFGEDLAYEDLERDVLDEE